MATYKTSGIIISRKDFSEADRIVTVFTRDHGKIKLLAKGIRKVRSRIGGRLEPFILAHLMVATGRSFDLVIGCEIIESFPKIRRSLQKTSHAYLLAETIDKLTVEHESTPKIFNLFHQCLQYIEKHGANDLLVIYFDFHLAQLIGFMPEIGLCVHCHQLVKSGQNYFSILSGGLICQKCQPTNQSVIAISDYQIKLARILIENEITILPRLTVKRHEEPRLLAELLNRYLQQIMEKEILSQKIINQIRSKSLIHRGSKGKNGSKI